VFAALPQIFDETKGVIEDRGIVWQRHAAEIAVLAIGSPDIDTSYSLPSFGWDRHGAVARDAVARVNLSQAKPQEARFSSCKRPWRDTFGVDRECNRQNAPGRMHR
jgi:hypothetical protein